MAGLGRILAGFHSWCALPVSDAEEEPDEVAVIGKNAGLEIENAHEPKAHKV
jgi:hypothetical protein